MSRQWLDGTVGEQVRHTNLNSILRTYVEKQKCSKKQVCAPRILTGPNSWPSYNRSSHISEAHIQFSPMHVPQLAVVCPLVRVNCLYSFPNYDLDPSPIAHMIPLISCSVFIQEGRVLPQLGMPDIAGSQPRSYPLWRVDGRVEWGDMGKRRRKRGRGNWSRYVKWDVLAHIYNSSTTMVRLDAHMGESPLSLQYSQLAVCQGISWLKKMEGENLI